MRGIGVMVAVLAAFALGPAVASAAPVTIDGTPGDDWITISATSPVSGTYSVNHGAPQTFAGATEVIVNGGGGDDKLFLFDNPAGEGLFAPPLGMRFDGGDGTDRFYQSFGSAISGSLDHDAAGPGTKTVTHTGAYVQTVRLESVDQVDDQVREAVWTYRGTAGSDDIIVAPGEQEPTSTGSSCCYPSYLSDASGTTYPSAKTRVVVDSKTSGATPDRVVVKQSTPLAQQLVVDDGAATPEDVVALDSSMTGYPEGSAPDVSVRAGTLEAAGTFKAGTLAVETNRVDASAWGFVPLRVDKLELQAHDPVHVRNYGDLQVGGVAPAIKGVTSTAGDVSIATAGKLTVLPLEDVNGNPVTLSANAMDLLGAPQTAGGTARLQPDSAGVPVRLGAVDDPAGSLSIGDGELDRINASRVEVGRPDSGAVVVSAPFDRPTTTLAVTGGAGFSASGVGSLGGKTLEIADGSASSRVWAIDGTAVRVDGSTIPYKATELLRVAGGSQGDTFFVTPSADVPFFLDGGDPSSSPGGDSLTYGANGRTTSGDADPPDGQIDAPGVKRVGFAHFESVSIFG